MKHRTYTHCAMGNAHIYLVCPPDGLGGHFSEYHTTSKKISDHQDIQTVEAKQITPSKWNFVHTLIVPCGMHISTWHTPQTVGGGTSQSSNPPPKKNTKYNRFQTAAAEQNTISKPNQNINTVEEMPNRNSQLVRPPRSQGGQNHAR
jgi:hypothetical protein